MTPPPIVSLIVDVPDEWQEEVDFATLRRLAFAVAEAEGLSGPLEIELSIVDAEQIRSLNSQFRGLDEVTDVLSFPQHGDEAEAVFVASPDGVDRLGDVVICLPRAREQAEEYGHSLAREVSYLFVHGVLHLLGYDHEEDAERMEMRRREEATLAAVGLQR